MRTSLSERSANTPRAGDPRGLQARRGTAFRHYALRRLVALWLPVLLLIVAVAYRVTLVFKGWPAIDSDEAITGLTARHIALYGDRPVFFWGEHYMGALQAYVAALFFKLFGSSDATLHLSVLLLALGFLVAMYFLGRLAYGPIVGLIVLLWLTFGPPIATLRELTAAGGYQDILLLGALVLLGVTLRLREPERIPKGRRAWLRCLATYAGIGLCAGIGLWSDLLILPVLVVAFAALVAMRPRELWRGAWVALVLAFVVGAFPYLEYNVLSGFNSYVEATTISKGGPGSHAPTGLRALGEQVDSTLSVALSAVLGSPTICVQQGGVWYSYPRTAARATPTAGMCNAANRVFSLAALVVYACAAWALLLAALARLRALTYTAGGRTERAERDEREGVQTAERNAAHGGMNWARLRGMARAAWAAYWSAGTRTPEVAEAAARWWLQAMLLGVAALMLLAYCASHDAELYQFTSVRYLLPFYLSTPLLFGQLWEWSAPLVSRVAGRLRGGGAARLGVAAPGRGLAALALVALIALSVGGAAAVSARASEPGAFGLPAKRADMQIISFLDAHSITGFYADYWTCYRLTFETNERIACAVRGQNGQPDLALMNNRYSPYIKKLARDPHPAYILPLGSQEDRRFMSLAAREHLPHTGYQRVVVGGYAVYYAAA